MIINEKLKKYSRRLFRMVLSPVLVVVVPSLVLVTTAQNSEFVYELLVYATYYCNVLACKAGEIPSFITSTIVESR